MAYTENELQDLGIPQEYWDYLMGAGQGGGEPNYTAWLPTNPGAYGAGNAGPSSYSWGQSPWVPNVDNMPMEGGNYGYMAPMARRVAGPSSLMDMVGGYLNNTGQPGGPAMMNQELIDYQGPGMLQAQNAASQMYSGYTNPWQTDAVTKYNQAFGTANAMKSGWNPLSGSAAERANQAQQLATIGAGTTQRDVTDRVNQAQQFAARRARPQDIWNDPALQAEQAAFKQTTMPMLQDQFSLMGLGRSGGAGQAVANAWTQAASPHLQAATQRETDRINRMTQTGLSGAEILGQTGYQMQGLGANTALEAANLYSGLANQRTNQQLGSMGIMSQLGGQIADVGNQFDARKLQANQQLMQANQAWGDRAQQGYQREYDLMDRMMNYGNQFRGISQQANDAQYEDYLRRQGLSEQMLMAPMGMLQAGIGQSTSGGGK